jgi:DNA uptake protein ComE-like DNA-binding protein
MKKKTDGMIPGSDAGKRRWGFSARERRAILLLLPLLGALVWLVSEALRPRFGDGALLLGDGLAGKETPLAADTVGGGASQLFRFDPNTVTYEELRLLGVAPRVAAGIVKYRAAGKVFALPEEFAACYGITDSAYACLKPYIVIGEAYRLQPRPRSAARTPEGRVPAGRSVEEPAQEELSPDAPLAPFDPNRLDEAGFVALGFSPRQARTILNFRDACGGFRTAGDLGRSRAVSGEMFARLEPYIVIASAEGGGEEAEAGRVARGEVRSVPVELNRADSVALLAVRGIGPATASAILAYRERLGGFRDREQVTETGLVTERNWELMKEQIWADSCAIRKIDINFAAPNAVAKHPYVTPRILRKMLRNRQLKGGWSTIEDMVEDNTLTSEEAGKLAPYLHFGTVPL